MQEHSDEVVKRIAAAFIDSGFEPQRAKDLAFHMTDWLDDLNEIVKLYGNISRATDEQLRKSIIQFLVHVPNHLAAAKKLIGLGSIEDVFDLGVHEKED
ncbi:MAG: hypothetical protein AB1898_12695 [Acidobacteriota bacterium]